MKNLRRSLYEIGKSLAKASTKKVAPYALALSALVPSAYAQVEMAPVKPASEMKNVSLQNAQYVTGPRSFDVTPIVGANADTNARNLEAACTYSDPTTNTIVVHLPSAVYDKSGINSVQLSRKPNMHFIGDVNPMPTNPIEAKEYPTTGTIIQDAVGISTYPGATLENLIFRIDPNDVNPPSNFMQIMEDNITIKNCYFIGHTNQVGGRAINIASASGVQNPYLEGNYIRDFNFSGANVEDINSKWRRNIFRNNTRGVYANSGADIGKNIPGEEGENVFIVKNVNYIPGGAIKLTSPDDERIAVVYGGNDYPMQNNYYYVEDGQGKLIQLKTEAEVIPFIEDVRVIPPTPIPGGINLQTIGADIVIPPIQQQNHVLFPTEQKSATRRSWILYQ